MPARAVAIVLSLVMTLALAACGSSGGASATPAAGGSVTVGDAWVRAKEAGGTTAAYMTITSGGAADELVSVSAPEVTNDASLHETTSNASGMTGMQHVDGIAVPAGGTVVLEPGGYHIMLMDLLKELKVGDTVTLTLTFEQTGTVEVQAEVRAS